MGLSHRKVGTAALAAGLGLARLASAQGFYYEDLTEYCAPEYDHRYLGCYAATANPFPWTPVNQDLSPVGDLSKSYIHWHTSTTWNTTITPHFCTEVCRAHGHKYAALWDGECSCGSSLDYKNQAGTSVTLSTQQIADSLCEAPQGCPGDRLEFCGTGTAARIFVDPSYEGTTDENALTDLATGYAYLGCFQDPNFPTSDTTVTAPTAQFNNPGLCFSYCADLGKPLVFMSSNAGDGGKVNCFCGQDFGVKAQQLTRPSDGTCDRSCTDITVSPCTGQNCCGTANGPFPVYANPALMGCYVPRIPGKSDPASVTPGWDSYQCFETPSSIANRVVTSASEYSGATITRTATFVASATPDPSSGSEPWILYACYGQDYIGQALVNYLPAPSSVPLTPDGCAEYCSTALYLGSFDYNYAALAGAGNNQQCYCAETLGSPSTGSNGPTMIEDCNLPCVDDDLTMCGNANGPIIYARPGSEGTGQYAMSSASYARTPVYSCTPTSDSTSSATSSTSSNATTTFSSSNITSSATLSTDSSDSTASETGSTSSASFLNGTITSASDTASTTSSATLTDTVSLPNSTITTSSFSDTTSATDTASPSSESESITSSSETASSSNTTVTTSSGTTSSSDIGNITESSTTVSVTSSSDIGNITESSTTVSVTSSSSVSGFFNTTSATESASSAFGTGSVSLSGTISASASSNFSATASASGAPSFSANATATTSSSSEPADTSSSSTSPTASETASPVPGETTVEGDILLAVFILPSGDTNLTTASNSSDVVKKAAKAKRQAADSGFVGGAGPINPTSCADATVFTLVNGLLGVGDEVVATDPGVPFMRFAVGDGAISVTWTLVDGALYWYNDAFVGGVAGFCQVPASGQVYATFSTPDIVPVGCVPVQLVAISEVSCVNGEVISVLPTSASATATPTGPTVTSSPLPTGIPSEEDIYGLNASPAGEICVTVTESWVPGQPTFIHEEL